MKYRVMDVIANQVVGTFEGEDELLRWWFKRNVSYKALNVTGKDIRFLYPAGISVAGVLYEKDSYMLRQYQVLDEEGRSVDIRLWETERPEKTDEWDERVYTGRKSKRRSGKGRSFARQMRREDSVDLELDVRPIRVNTNIRKGYSGYYFKPMLDRMRKCWKDRKTARQWGRHTKGFASVTSMAKDACKDIAEIDAEMFCLADFEF